MSMKFNDFGLCGPIKGAEPDRVRILKSQNGPGLNKSEPGPGRGLKTRPVECLG